MESLPADIQRKIALDLSPGELFTLCLDNTYKKNICESREFWLLKLERDYPNMLNYFNRHGMKIKNPKDTYINKFTKYSEAAERFINNWYLPEERQDNYNLLYKLYKESIEMPITDYLKEEITMTPLVLKYPPLLRSPKLENTYMGEEVYKFLLPFVKAEQKYKY